MEVGISHRARIRSLPIALALVALVGCAPPPGIRGAARPTPSAGDRPATNANHPAANDGGDGFQTVVTPPSDSLRDKLQATIQRNNEIFDVIDSSFRVVMLESAPATPAAAGAPATETTWDIDVRSYVTHDKVTRYLDLFLGSARDRFVARLQRGRRFEPMIRARFRRAGIPEDMYYLGLVESGFDPNAYSRAAAVGMWQFMSTTAREIGLRVDWWVDERRDPVRATDAAARFISDLRDQFGSLYLAAAAYNGGPGRVSRGLAKFSDEMDEVSGEDRFFALARQDYLRSETKNYVPQLIAAALIGKNPTRYDILLDSVAPFAYDSVIVPPATPLAAIAAASGASVHELQELNPQILRGTTPPDVPLKVRIPVGTASAFAGAIAGLPVADRTAFIRIVSRKGQTLASIARQHALSVKQLLWYNHRLVTPKGTARLSPGQPVLVPSPEVVSAAIDVPDPSIERYGTSGSSGTRLVHVVKRGESLGSLSRRYRTNVSTLVRLNGLKKPVIYPGQTIIVRAGSTRARTPSRKSTSKTAVHRSADASTGGKKQAAGSSKSPAARKVATK